MYERKFLQVAELTLYLLTLGGSKFVAYQSPFSTLFTIMQLNLKYKEETEDDK